MVGQTDMRIARLVWVGTLLATAMLTQGCRSVPFAAGIYVSKGKPFLIAESPAYGWGVLSHPRVIKVSDDLIVVRYYVGGDNANWNDPAARDIKGRSPAISRDGGKTWTFGEENLDPRIAAFTYYFGWDISLPDVTLLGVRSQFIRVYTKEEHRIEGPFEMQLLTNGYPAGGPWHRGAVLADGTLISGTYYDPTDWRGMKKGSIHFVVSTNGGFTWEVRSKIADPDDAPWAHKWLGFDGPDESTVVGLGSQRVVCIMRTGTRMFTRFEAAKSAERMLIAFSKDAGRTWKKKVLSAEGVYPRLCKMSNGVLALGFGRPGNNLIFSTDGGRTWGHELAITAADVNTSGYCDLVEVEPGKLLVVFDAHDWDLDGVWLWEPKKQNGLFGVFVTVRRLF